MLSTTYLPQMKIITPYFISIAKIGLTITLFLIGAGLNGAILKAVGLKPLAQGILLWICIALATLTAIIYLK